ncbi:type II toxin-antitoxin system RelE/ParE family toxin [Martelella mediterranea]|uniref:type II toxin-antitoxin system RelE/ParE family toxin n=1 Tax=Martelella mediterranea TaxID=293089 RepID=UPI001E418715|nr:type II toxin-antitoxin system RelE/ParE family toxin [Martelella mediterranea]MCD1636377.1 type II toxin-antitoxin system RelE/ParE family toxin [Martelella mediterranea]
MPSSKLQYRLTPKAFEDLDEVWRYTAENWSLDQADHYIDGLAQAFDMIASMPLLARERIEFDPPIRVHHHQSHLVIYTINKNQIDIIRILGGRQDWQVILRATE